jgi:hypothetical protein
MIEGYLNQRAVWKRKIGSNEYGEPVTKQQDNQSPLGRQAAAGAGQSGPGGSIRGPGVLY